MHAKSGLRVVLEWKIYRPDSVIAAVIRLESGSNLKRKFSIIDLFHVFFLIAVLCSWCTVPEKPSPRWNTNIFPHVPAEPPLVYSDNGRQPPSVTHGVSFRWTVNYKNGHDLFHAHHRRGWNDAVWSFLKDDFETFVDNDDVRDIGGFYDRMMTEDWYYYHYDYASELGYRDAKIQIDKLLENYSKTELKSLLTDYPNIRKHVFVATIVTIFYVFYTIGRYQLTKLNRRITNG